MTLQAMETENKTLDPQLILAGTEGLFESSQCGKYYVVVGKAIESIEILDKEE